MRILRSYSIEEDLVEKLKSNNNKSGLINNLLREYFDKDDINQMNAKQLETELEIRKMVREHKKAMEALQSKKMKQS